MVDFGAVIKRPFSDMKKLLIGSILYMIPIVNFITGFFVSGYMLEAARLTMKKKNDMPEWTRWWSLFVQGLLVTIIFIIYMLPGFVVFFIFGGASALALLQEGNLALASFAGLGLAFMLFLVFVLLAAFFAPAAILGYAQSGRFGSAFALGTIFRKVFTGAYISHWFFGFIATMVIGLIAGMISSILAVTIVGPIIVQGFAGFINGIIFITFVAEGYTKA